MCVGVKLCESAALQRAAAAAAAAWLLSVSPGGDGGSLAELPVQTANSWKQTVTTGPLCLRGEQRGEERGGRAGNREGSLGDVQQVMTGRTGGFKILQ